MEHLMCYKWSTSYAKCLIWGLQIPLPVFVLLFLIFVKEKLPPTPSSNRKEEPTAVLTTVY